MLLPATKFVVIDLVALGNKGSLQQSRIMLPARQGTPGKCLETFRVVTWRLVSGEQEMLLTILACTEKAPQHGIHHSVQQRDPGSA